MASHTWTGATIVKELLNRKNYLEWSVCIESYLLGQGLWDVVERDCKKPTVVWKKKNAKAFHAILMSSGPEAVGLILDCSPAEDSARDAWVTLATVYNSGEEVVKVFLHNNNYREWRVSMKSYLLAQGLWDVVKPSESESDKSSEIDVWEENAKAFEAIKMSCEEEAVGLILDCSPAEDSARDAWVTLATVYNSGEEVVKVFLRNNNYRKWRVSMKSYLLAQGLWDVVKPSESESDKSSEIDVWKEKNAKAFEAIKMSCETEAKNLILNCSLVQDSARDAWNTLASAYNSGAVIVKELLIKAENYKEWSVCMKKYLVGNNLWSVVESGNISPSESQSDVNWKRKNDLAFHIISVSCGNEVARLISDLSSAKAAWDKLADEYKGCLTDGYYPQYRLLYEAIQFGDWEKTWKFVHDHPEALTAKISSKSQTPLHVAAEFAHPHIVEGLVELMAEEDLELKDEEDATPLIQACCVEITKMAECMVNKNKNLLTIPLNYMLPVTYAVSGTNKEMARYLYSVTPVEVLLPENGYCGAILLMRCLSVKCFLDMALHLLTRCPQLAITPNNHGKNFLEELAYASSIFPSGGCQLRFFQKWIYNRISINPTVMVNEFRINVQSTNTRASDGKISLIPGLLDRAASAFGDLLGFNQIYETKLVHRQSQELLHITCEQIKSLSYKELKKCRGTKAILQAAQRGICELVIELIKANSRIAWSSDSVHWNFFYSAIQHRQTKVFSLIFGYIWKFTVTNTYNGDRFTMLHMAAKLAPQEQLNRIPGAALQMQRELQWFKEVESIMPIEKMSIRNKAGLTAKDLFSQEHKNLVKEGEKWMKETATSCTVVGALIITIMFATAFTVPGGNDQNTGYPIFKDQKPFIFFLISNAISLFSSSTSVLMFLGILTSRYKEEDFFKSLPTKLIIGLSLLFISIAMMMATFCAALFIMLEGKLWIIAPVILLATIPIGLFVRLQYPLLAEIFVSTFGQGIFDRNANRWP